MNHVIANVACLLAALTPSLGAQGLLRDIKPGAPSSTPASTPHALVSFAGKAYFFASDEVHGQELWSSDGTPAGTQLVLDAVPGAMGFAAVGALRVMQGAMYFLAADSVGYGLWRSDGTALGTAPVKRFAAMLVNDPETCQAGQSTLYFVASDGVAGLELWRSDGTANGTVMVADVNPGPAGAFANNLSNLTSMLEIGGILFFTANDGSTGIEVHKTDGTAAGTTRVTDIKPGGVDSYPGTFWDFQGELLFVADTTGGYTTWWLTDGTSQGTRQVSPLPVNSGRLKQSTWVSGNLLFCPGLDGATGVEPWVSDGTPAGTRLLRDIKPGFAGSFPDNFIEYQGAVYFRVTDPTSSSALWKTDGTTAGTVQVAAVGPAAGARATPAIVEWNDQLYMEAVSPGLGSELWKSDGLTAGGTVLLRDLWPGAASGFPTGFTPLATKLLFVADDGSRGVELWSTDGTAAGTTLVADLAATAKSSTPTALFSHRGLAFFVADDGVAGQEPWVTDGTVAGTRRLADTAPGASGSFVNRFFAWQNDAWFVTLSGLWRSNGITAQQALPGPVFEVLATDSALYFGGAQVGLYVSDGTPAGTTLVRDFNRGFYAATPHAFVSRNDKVYFMASEGLGMPSGLWESDGTAAGTQLRYSTPVFLGGGYETVADANAVYAFGGLGGVALVRVDDTSAVLLAQFPSLGLAQLVSLPGRLLFHGSDSAGVELWSSDGTVAGTQRLLDIRPGSLSSAPSELIAVNGLAFFAADNGTHGRELWVSDGTAAGTRMVLDAMPGAAGANPTSIRPAGTGSRVVYSAWDANGGNEVWTSDGTAAGTRRVVDLAPGVSSANPSGFANAGTTLVFAAQDPGLGVELWAMPLALTGASLAEPFGVGCPGTGGLVPAMGAVGAPALGNAAFALTLRQARAQSALGVFVAAAAAPVALPGGCQLLTGTPIVTVPGSSDVLGQWNLPLPIANNPAFLGGELVFQTAVADPQGAFLGLVAFSDGLRILIGQ